MGLEESPHCPFDVMEACRTGVRRDYHQPGWESSRPTAWPSPIRDRQDDSFEQQEVSGRDGSGWLGARLVVPVAVGREGSKRSVVAAAGVMVVQRRRWIGMEQMMGAFKAVALKEPTGHRTLKSGWR